MSLELIHIKCLQHVRLNDALLEAQASRFTYCVSAGKSDEVLNVKALLLEVYDEAFEGSVWCRNVLVCAGEAGLERVSSP